MDFFPLLYFLGNCLSVVVSVVDVSAVIVSDGFSSVVVWGVVSAVVADDDSVGDFFSW